MTCLPCCTTYFTLFDDYAAAMMVLEVARVSMLGLVNLLIFPGYGFSCQDTFSVSPYPHTKHFWFNMLAIVTYFNYVMPCFIIFLKLLLLLLLLIIQVMEIKSNKLKGENSRQIISITKSKGKPVREISSNCTLPQITPDEYASRCAMLHSLVVAWSPMLRFSSKNFPIPQNGSSSQFSVLAIGGKSGKISFWRISAPKCYSIEHSNIDPTLVQVGLLQAHNSWITAISWALLSSNSSNPQVLLVTGSSDGR